MSRVSLLTVLLCAAPLWAQGEIAPPAPAPLPLTLDTVIERALTTNLSVARAAVEVDALEAQRRLILSTVLPRVTATGAYTRNSLEVAFGEGDDAAIILPENDWNVRLNVSQPIYAGNRERRAYEQAKIAVESARDGLELTREQVLLEAVADFFAVATGETLLEVERQNVAVSERFLGQARDFFDAGEATQVETLRAEVNVKAGQRALTAAQQLRDSAEGRLRINLRLEGPIVVDTTGASIPVPPSEEELIASALTRNPLVQLAQNEVSVAELEVRKQRGFALPTVTFDAAWIQQKAQFPYDSYGQASINFNVPIWQSGETGARVSVARHRLEQSRLTLAETRQRIEEDVRIALLDLRSAETTLSLAEEQTAAAQAEYDQIFDLYRAQEATSLDVQSAEVALSGARRSVVEASLSVQLARLRAWYAAGLLEEVAKSEV